MRLGPYRHLVPAATVRICEIILYKFVHSESHGPRISLTRMMDFMIPGRELCVDFLTDCLCFLIFY